MTRTLRGSKNKPLWGFCIGVYSGQYYDQETGLHYNYHRYYDPSLGRYLRADPIGLAGGINPYAYVENDPVNYIDQYGLTIGDMPPAPPGYNLGWRLNIYDYGIELVDPEGNRWLAHPEDEGHWRHWHKKGPDDKGSGPRWPNNSKKPWPNQKKLKKDQSSCDPNGDAPPFEPDMHYELQRRYNSQYPFMIYPMFSDYPIPTSAPVRIIIFRPILVP